MCIRLFPVKRYSWVGAVVVLIALVIVAVFLIRPALELPKSTSPVTWKISYIFHGTGKSTTTSFTVAHHWRIVWDCEASPTPYNFSLVVYDAFTQKALDIAVNTTCHNRQGGVVDELKGSYIFLLIYSYTGTWHIAIQEMK